MVDEGARQIRERFRRIGSRARFDGKGARTGWAPGGVHQADADFLQSPVSGARPCFRSQGVGSFTRTSCPSEWVCSKLLWWWSTWWICNYVKLSNTPHFISLTITSFVCRFVLLRAQLASTHYRKYVHWINHIYTVPLPRYSIQAVRSQFPDQDTRQQHSLQMQTLQICSNNRVIMKASFLFPQWCRWRSVLPPRYTVMLYDVEMKTMCRDNHRSLWENTFSEGWHSRRPYCDGRATRVALLQQRKTETNRVQVLVAGRAYTDK